jgi:putative nucleotidyltransferase with HDIG domain
MQSIWALVQALEAKDVFAERHSENVMHYVVGIARMMEIGPRQIEVIRRAAMIHDIGKIGVPDAILAKPDRLTPDERTLVEQHPVIAARILSKMSFLEREMAMVRHHHEKWNGQGYPDGLSRSSIPLGARILAVADTFDALTANRAYNDSRSVATAMKILIDSAGYDLDPEIVAAMFNWVEAIGKKLGKTTDQLTSADLLDSQIQPPESEPPVASAAAIAASVK